eukprot:GFUD01120688.1.p1 GENE.GFUD01120688.1~~GFUD01120688.1.p1  ORF type:complete len:154 (-),score=63.14 GFUD01120688.1:104-565(-)
MKAVVQRVLSGSVTVEGEVVSRIGKGMVALVGIHKDDTKVEMDYIVRKLVSLRMWEDESGRRWAKSAKDLGLEVLCVSQFTLYHVMKGNKPDFHLAMGGDQSKQFYLNFLEEIKKAYKEDKIKDGVFGANMQVELVNDGPVTLELEVVNQKKQ